MLHRNISKDSDFRFDIPEYTDERIIDILKKRDYYQSEAVQLAIDEAIKRGIIYSEQDLFADEYKVKPLKTSLIPEINRQENKTKIRKSIARSMVLCGIMPLVFGLLNLNKGNFPEGAGMLAVALVWMYCSSQLIKHYKRQLVFMLLVLVIVSLVYVVVNLSKFESYVFMDFFIPLTLSLLIIYGLFFLKRIFEK